MARDLKQIWHWAPIKSELTDFFPIFSFHSWESLCKELPNVSVSRNAYTLLAIIRGKGDENKIESG